MMGSVIHRQTAKYLAIVFAIFSLSACGEKKEVHGARAGETLPTTNRLEEVPNSGGIEVPLPSPEPGEPAPSASESGEYLVDPLDDQAGYDPVDPKQIERTDVDKRYTGMEDDGGLLYTGSSSDYILTYLRLRNEDPTLDAGVKARNLAAAQSIESARMSFDKFSGDVVINLKIREGSLTKTYTLGGGVDEDSRVSKLTGSKQIEGKMKCLDLHKKTCETAFARLLIGSPGQKRAAVAIVFRQSLADYRVQFAAKPADPRAENPEYEFIREFWRNTNLNVNTHHKLKNIYLNSFEIVNGRSGFDVQVLGEGRQLLSFGGPLLAPDVGSSVSITADRTPQVIESSDLESLTNYNYAMADYIGGAKIVNNNGLGQVRIAVKMRKRGGSVQDSFRLTIMRIIKPTVTPNEENLRMN